MTPEPRRIAIIATDTGAAGGAERLNLALAEAIEAQGCQVEIVALPAPEPDPDTIIRNYDAFAELDLSRFDAVISTKAPTYAVQHPNHILYLVHTVRAFDDMFDQVFPLPEPEHYRHRYQVQQRDFQALTGARKRFAIGHEVATRLYKWRGLGAEVIHPPLAMGGFHNQQQGDYFYLPSRLHRWKRVDLAIRAVLESELPLRLIISGTGEDQKALEKLASGDPRIEFRGHISDDELRELYAGALAVPFLPVREDYGYVTLEAFASEKPVITCVDSGEPTRFVRQHETGLLCQPEPESVRLAMEWLYNNREGAAAMGAQGKAVVEGMAWDDVAARLMAAAFEDESPARAEAGPLRVATFDMQPIDPPVGGGRLRLLGLYHNLGDQRLCHYLGSYDWEGEPGRDQWLTERLREITVPLSERHHQAAAALASECGGKVVIDIAFSSQAHLTPDYLERARREMAEADVVVFSHPWVYPLLAEHIQPHQIVVYDSHNVEGFLRAQLLDESNETEANLLARVARDEYRCGKAADLILTCSQEDLERFCRIYEFPPARMRVLANGVMAHADKPASADEKSALRRELGLDPDAFTAIFIGSPYGPNAEAADFIATQLTSALPEVVFVLAGGVSQGMGARARNLVCTGQLPEADKNRWLKAADIAINPMFSGSGTNIKMFDFMALGLPTVVTTTGARGIDAGTEPAFLEVAGTRDAFVRGISQLRESPDQRARMAQAARHCVETTYAWERLSPHLGAMLDARRRTAGQPRPMFSVVIPSYQRHDQLSALMDRLEQQVERDFEVIIVDQSAAPWPERDRDFGIPVTYYHTDVKGAIRARNTGAALASGDIIAFTDDDCLPYPHWLLNARDYFDDPAVVGVEGRVESDNHGDPDYRPVTNVGLQGLGFMTANLLVRSAAFQLLGGFDLQFDHPHFREDTDFGWRLQALGVVPYSNGVAVFHPAQPRDNDRESVSARARFFRKDARLYRKHPEKYRELFFCERHFETYPGFGEQLLAGFREIDMPVPDWISAHLAQSEPAEPDSAPTTDAPPPSDRPGQPQ